MFASALDNDHVQVTVRYDVLAGDVSTALKLANVTYVLRDNETLWQFDDIELVKQLTYRVPWDSYLS